MAAKKKDDNESTAFKDRVDRTAVTNLGKKLKSVYPKFDVKRFADHVCDDNFLKLELLDRIRAIASGLQPFLPKDYRKAVDVIVKAAANNCGFNWALTGYIEKFGVEDFETSVPALKELTKYGSSEFAIRPFMINYPDRMMPVLHDWAVDENEDVRRLAAEGSRPRGVWVAHIEAFKKDPKPVLELLDKMKTDESKYVQKAVANNLNDISREHPDLVIKTAKQWLRNGDKNTAWIVRRACRSLIKQGHPDVFEIFGFTPNPKVTVKGLKLTPSKLKIGGDLTIGFEIVSSAKKEQRLAVDYRVEFQSASGKPSSKVFKLSEKSIAAGGTLPLQKKHSFVPATTRKLFPGEHKVEIIINGKSAGTKTFMLTKG